MAHVAFIGLGVTGYPMAGHLAARGHAVTAYNRTASHAGARVTPHGNARAATPAAAAQGADAGNDADQVYRDVQAMGGGRWDTSRLIRRLR